MPTVPYNPVSSVSPGGQSTPYFNDRGATPEAFGAGVGASMEKFGGQLERTSDTIETHVLRGQAFINEADVNAAVTADIQTSGELNNKFRLLPGNQAQAGLDDHVKALKESREKLRDTLTNPTAKKMFDQQTMHRYALDTVNSSQYAATQAKQYLKQSIVDNSETIIQDMARDPTNPAVIAKGIKDLQDNEVKLGKLDGDDPDAINKKIRNRLTQATSALAGSIAKKDPAQAQKILDTAKNSGKIDLTKVDQIQNTIDDRAIQTYASLDAHEISQNLVQSDLETFNRDPEGTLAKMNAAAEKKAEERYKDDPINKERYLTQLQSNIGGKFNLAKKAQSDQLADLKGIVSGLAGQQLPGTGRKPANITEMNTLNPKAQEYYEAAVKRDPSFATRMKTIFTTNNDEDKIVEPGVLQKQQEIWAGMQPTDKAKAEPAKLFQEGKIDIATRNSMLLEQNKIRGQANTVFAADAIMRQHGALLTDAGIFQSKTNAEANEKYTRFRGALESELQRIQGKTGVPVKGTDTNQVINGLLKGMQTPGRFWGTNEKPTYEVLTSDQPDWIKKSEYRDAIKNPANGKWFVWREGKPMYLEETK